MPNVKEVLGYLWAAFLFSLPLALVGFNIKKDRKGA